MLINLARRLRFPLRRFVPQTLRSEIHYRLIDNRITRRIYDALNELDIIEIELHDLKGKRWQSLTTRSRTGAMSERVVEIPWVLSRYQGERRVLDIGPAYALPLYLRRLRMLHVPELHGVDLTEARLDGIITAQADVRSMPYPDGLFDLIICISTLEHIGCDNARYRLQVPVDPQGDLHALIEMRRVLADQGRILVTVPYGRPQDYGWFRQYDGRRWQRLVDQARLEIVEQACYGYSDAGWIQFEDPSVLESRGYQEMGAPAATAVLCASLKRAAAA